MIGWQDYYEYMHSVQESMIENMKPIVDDDPSTQYLKRSNEKIKLERQFAEASIQFMQSNGIPASHENYTISTAMMLPLLNELYRKRMTM